MKIEVSIVVKQHCGAPIGCIAMSLAFAMFDSKKDGLVDGAEYSFIVA